MNEGVPSCCALDFEATIKLEGQGYLIYADVTLCCLAPYSTVAVAVMLKRKKNEFYYEDVGVQMFHLSNIESDYKTISKRIAFVYPTDECQLTYGDFATKVIFHYITPLEQHIYQSVHTRNGQRCMKKRGEKVE